jgi:DUF4097 and DUF4098 domain-containing protein YvlB
MRNPFAVLIVAGLTLFSTNLAAQTPDEPPQAKAVDEAFQRALERAKGNIERQMAQLRRQTERLRIDSNRLARQLPVVPPAPAFPVAPVPRRAPQDRQVPAGPEQTEHFSRKIHLERNGSVSVSNVSGEIVVTGVGGDDVSIEAVKRTHGDASRLAMVQIDATQHAGRIDIETHYPWQNSRGFNQGISVDYTITVPTWAAVDLRSVSGGVKITGVEGAVRAESVSGGVIASSTPKLELVKTVSGNVDLSGVTAADDFTATSVSGDIRAKNLKARSLDLHTVSGEIALTDVASDRFTAKSVSGGVAYSGSLASGGRYDINTHSGDVRLTLTAGTGFELSANTFSGSIRSDLPLTLGGDRGEIRSRGASNRLIHATFANGSAALTVRTFSGDIVIAKR